MTEHQRTAQARTGAWEAFCTSYDRAKVLEMCTPKSLAGALFGVFLFVVVPAWIPPLARHGGITHHWLVFGVFCLALSCSHGFYRVRGERPWGPVLTAGDTMLSNTAFAMAVLTTTGHVRYAYAALQGVALIALYAKAYGFTSILAVLLAIPVLVLPSAAVAFFGVESEVLVIAVALYTITLWTSNLTRDKQLREAKTAELRAALLTTDGVANRAFELALTRTALTVGDTLHELRNHLSVVGAGLDYLHESLPDDPDVRASVSDSLDSFRRAREVLEGTMSKLRRSRDEHLVTFDATETIRTFGAATKLSGASLHVEGDSQAFLVHGDGDALRSVLTNLTRNAVKAGARQVSITHRISRADKSLRIEVADDARGIDPKLAGELFQKPFVTGREHDGGTGLGLYLSRRQIELMDGSISVSSVVPLGTRFTIMLPGTEQVSAS